MKRASDGTRSRMSLSAFPALKNDCMLRAARGEATEWIPVWMMRQAGRYLPEYQEVRKDADFFTMCRTPELACKVSLQPLERFPTLDAVIIFSDILVIPQAMGMEVLMVKGKGPVFPDPLKVPEDIQKLTLKPDIESTLGYVFDAVNLTRERIAGRVPLIGFSGAPFTLMAYMIEGGGSRTLSKAKTWLFKHPEATHKLLQALTDIIVEYLVGKVKAGAQMLQVFESNGGDLTPDHFTEFSLPYLSQIASRVKAAVDVPMTVFARGANQEGALEALASTEYNTISVDWRIEPSDARKRAGNKTLQGNLDPGALYAAPETLRKLVAKMVKGFGTQRYIANLGHGMHPSHDPEMAGNFIDAVHACTN